MVATALNVDVITAALCLLLLFCGTEASSSFEWETVPEPTVYSCRGNTISFPWRFRTADDTNVKSIGWLFETVKHAVNVATMSTPIGNLEPTEKYQGRLASVANGGFDLNNVTLEDSGKYTVEVGVVTKSNGSYRKYFNSSSLEVAAVCHQADGPSSASVAVAEDGEARRTIREAENQALNEEKNTQLTDEAETLMNEDQALSEEKNTQLTGEADTLMNENQALNEEMNTQLTDEAETLMNEDQALSEEKNTQLTDEAETLLNEDQALSEENQQLKDEIEALKNEDEALKKEYTQLKDDVDSQGAALKALKVQHKADMWNLTKTSARLSLCHNYTMIHDPKRSTKLPGQNNELIRSDEHLAEGWYRFKLNNHNAVIPSACVHGYRCSTLYGFWLDLEGQELPGPGQQIAGRACGVYGKDAAYCCHFRTSGPVYLHNCGGFFIYRLLPTQTWGQYCTEPQFP